MSERCNIQQNRGRPYGSAQYREHRRWHRDRTSPAGAFRRGGRYGRTLFREVYSLNPKERVDWFLSTYQSPESIREQILSGTVYAFILLRKERIGFVAYEKDSEVMCLSKLYLLKEYRGKGVGGHIEAA